MSYRLLSVADSELTEAAQSYEKQAAGLGKEFLDEFEAVMSRIMRFPEAWTRAAHGIADVFPVDFRMQCFTRIPRLRFWWLE